MRSSCVQRRFSASAGRHPSDHSTTVRLRIHTEAPRRLPQAPPLRSSERLCSIGMSARGQGRPEADHDLPEEHPTFFGCFVVPQPVCLGPKEQKLFVLQPIPSPHQGEQTPSPFVAPQVAQRPRNTTEIGSCPDRDSRQCRTLEPRHPTTRHSAARNPERSERRHSRVVA